MTTQERLTHNLELKHTYSGAELQAMAMEVAEAMKEIDDKSDDLKETTKRMKEEIETAQLNMRDIIERLAQGYELRTVECFASYENGTAKFTDKETGEVLEERPITEAEQLRLNENRIDAEDIIRESRENE